MSLWDRLFGEDPRDLQQIALEQQWEMNNEMYAYNWGITQDNYAFALESLALQKLNDAVLRAYREQAEFNAWQNRENLRLYEYSKEVEAYNKGVESYEEQIEFNTHAELIALVDADRAYQDKLIAFGFQNQDLLMKVDEAFEQGNLDKEGLQKKLTQATNLKELQEEQLTVNKEWDKAQAALDSAGLREGLAATKAEMAFKSEQARIENIQALGQQKNLGQSGRSAQKALSALLANHGQSQAAMADSISRSESKYMLDKRRVAETLAYKNKLSKIKGDEITDIFNATKDDITAAEKGIDLKFEQLQDRTEFGQEQIQASIESAGEQYLSDKNRIEIDKHQADIQATKLLTSVPTIQPAESLPLQIPETQFQDPQKPTPPPEPVLGANTIPSQGLVQKASQVMSIAAAASVAFSDIQLKENITLVGKSGKGLPIYEFNYKNDKNQRYQGVMAQDLLTTDYANAVSTGSDGFYQVDYSQLDVTFKKI